MREIRSTFGLLNRKRERGRRLILLASPAGKGGQGCGKGEATKYCYVLLAFAIALYPGKGMFGKSLVQKEKLNKEHGKMCIYM